jgi:hypothetical protein
MYPDAVAAEAVAKSVPTENMLDVNVKLVAILFFLFYVYIEKPGSYPIKNQQLFDRKLRVAWTI